MEEEINKDFISTAELAKLLGLSRVAIFKNIDKKRIPATRVGRAYVINKKDMPAVMKWFKGRRAR